VLLLLVLVLLLLLLLLPGLQIELGDKSQAKPTPCLLSLPLLLLLQAPSRSWMTLCTASLQLSKQSC
jgi:hypothetical protein